MASLQAQIKTLQQRLDDPALYAPRPQGLRRDLRRLVSAQTDLAAAEEKWLQLEIRREEIEGG